VGRRTWDTLPPTARQNRTWQVVTSHPLSDASATAAQTSIYSAKMWKSTGVLRNETAWVCGGGKIYTELVPHCDYIYISWVKTDLIEGAPAVLFPLDLLTAEAFESIAEQNHGDHVFQILRRRTANDAPAIRTFP
jgi:dihydrofolate reductase